MAQRQNDGSLRKLKVRKGLVDLYSNDYLGYARRPVYANVSGGTGSRLISGNTVLKEEVEAWLASAFGSESSLFFNSGYDANVGLFGALSQKGVTFLYDELIHASIRDGIRLGHAKAYRFSHNDLNDLESKLARIQGPVIVAVESVYSMDGDLSPLTQIRNVCSQYGALLVVDEAHATGVMGKGGLGLAQEFQDEVIRVVTFSKALGAHGAIVLGPRWINDYLVNFARSFIYTTALSDYHFQHIRALVQKMMHDEQARSNLKMVCHCFDDATDFLSHEVISRESAIRAIMIPGNEPCVRAEQVLEKFGFAAKGVLAPTVPQGKERLRISLHAFNSCEEMARVATAIKTLWNEGILYQE